MKSFNQELKTALLAEVEKHRLADQIISGSYGSMDMTEFKGCAVGCSLHSYAVLKGLKLSTNDHGLYESLLGIPKEIAHLVDGIFEGLPGKLRPAWPGRVLAATPTDADLSLVINKFLAWLLIDPVDGVLQFANTPGAREAVIGVANLHNRVIAGETVSNKDWNAASDAARSAASDASSAASDASYVTRSARYAGYAAHSASDASDASDAARIKQADKLLTLLNEFA